VTPPFCVGAPIAPSASVDHLVLPIAIFGIATLAGIGVLVLAWPLLRMPAHRGRTIAILGLVIVIVVCAVIGQALLDMLAGWCR
jgi:hypothetical protein